MDGYGYTGPDRRRARISEATVREIYERLSRIETMLGERCAGRQSALDNHEERLLALENAEQRRRGASAVLALLAGLAGGGAALLARVFSEL